MAKTSRPASAASRAVIREPLRGAASTTRQPRASPAMMRLRRGKLWATAGVPSGNSLITAPCSAMLRARPWLRAGYRRSAPVPITATVPAAVANAPPVCGGIDAQGQPADDAQSGFAQGAGEGFGIALALGGGVAAADHGQHRAVEQFRAAFEVKQYGRVPGVEQALRILGVGQCNQAVAGLPGPGQGRIDGSAAIVLQQALGNLRVDHGGQRARTRGEDSLRRTKGLEQGAARFTANAGDQRQAQPACQFHFRGWRDRL
jgi:hypothetical protein